MDGYLSASRLAKQFGGTRVLDGVDFSLQQGECLVLLGPSGCGKTTLLSMIAGMVKPREGTVLLDGTPITGTTNDTAYMLARDALLPWRTARDNVELGLSVRGVPREERHEASTEWLRKVGLDGFGDSSILRLSQGMRQRVAIARTLALNPKCILMDEPFAALDAQTRVFVQEEFIKLWETERPTVIFVTHDLAEAILLGDRVILMSSRPGRIVEDIRIDLPRPRNLEEPSENHGFDEIHGDLARRLRAEVISAQAKAETQGKDAS